MKELILEIKSLIEEQLALRPDNMVEEQYKSRTISNYSTALKNLVEIERRNQNESSS